MFIIVINLLGYGIVKYCMYDAVKVLEEHTLLNSASEDSCSFLNWPYALPPAYVQCSIILRYKRLNGSDHGHEYTPTKQSWGGSLKLN